MKTRVQCRQTKYCNILDDVVYTDITTCNTVSALNVCDYSPIFFFWFKFLMKNWRINRDKNARGNHCIVNAHADLMKNRRESDE